MRAIVESLPSTTIVKRKVPCPAAQVFSVLRRIEELFNAGASRDATDGLRLAWKDRWLQVRASNTEPIVRVIAEARSGDAARELAERAEAAVRAVLEG